MESFTLLKDLDYTLPPSKVSAKHKSGNPKSTLDLYLPIKKSQNRKKQSGGNNFKSDIPIVIFVHGGGWRRGDKSAWKHYLSFHDTNLFVALILWYYNLYGNVGETLVQQDIACAIVNYPLGKLSFPHVLLEIFTSFLSSSLCLSLPTFLFWIALMVIKDLFIMRVWSNDYPIQLLEYIYIHITTVIFLSIALPQLLKCAAMFFNRKRYKMTIWSILLHTSLVAGSGIGLLLLSLSSTCTVSNEQIMKVWCIVVSLYTESIIIYKYVTELDIINNSNQAEAIAKCISWVKEYGNITGSFNPNWIFLMGHSAGGHLVSLVTLNDKYLRSEGCSRSDIKGVISISGVYNIKMLTADSAFGFVESFYIHPIFGSSKTDQEEASPFFHLASIQSDALPPFLICNAERDYILLNDAKKFVTKRKLQGHNWDHIIVQGTNHLNIMTHFGGKSRSKCNLASLCAQFTRDILNALSENAPQTNSSKRKC